jgi:hypothetical protein
MHNAHRATQDRASAKAERLAARSTKAAVVVAEDDPLACNYGDTPLVQSAEVTGRVWTRLSDLGAAHVGQRVLVRGRVHTLRGKGKSAFLILRQHTSTLQARTLRPHATHAHRQHTLTPLPHSSARARAFAGGVLRGRCVCEQGHDQVRVRAEQGERAGH